jgi:phage terminase small subunit
MSLSPEAKKLKSKLLRDYAIEDEAGTVILQIAMEAFDRMRQAQKAVDDEGLTTSDRFGQVKAHPMLATERDSRVAFLGALARLHLDFEPLGEVGRPTGGGKSRNRDV